MERFPVDSSNIAAIGYEKDLSVLEVEFKNGSVYQYYDVPENIFNDIMGADSKGKYLAQFVKGTFRYSRV